MLLHLDYILFLVLNKADPFGQAGVGCGSYPLDTGLEVLVITGMLYAFRSQHAN